MAGKPKNRYPGVYRTPAGAWRYVVEIPSDEIDEHGKPRRSQKSVSIGPDGKRFATAEAARDERARHLTELAKPKIPESDHGSLAEFLELWFRRLDVRDSTCFTYRRTLDHYVLPYLGAIPLGELHQRHIVAWHDHLKSRPVRHVKKSEPRTLSMMTIRNAHVMLSSAMNVAVALDMVPRNVVALVPAPAAPPPKTNAWTRDEAQRFLAHITIGNLAALWRLMLSTGMRIGEALALTWDDVELDRGIVHIRRTVTRDTAGRRLVGSQPKTPSSLRSVAIPQAAVEALRHHHDMQQFQRSSAVHRWEDHNLVFTRWDGRLYSAETLRLLFHRCCREAGVTEIRLHDLRHTAATLMVEAGEHLQGISQRLGHHSIKTTSDLYVHGSMELDRGVAERLEAYLSNVR